MRAYTPKDLITLTLPQTIAPNPNPKPNQVHAYTPKDAPKQPASAGTSSLQAAAPDGFEWGQTF